MNKMYGSRFITHFPFFINAKNVLQKKVRYLITRCPKSAPQRHLAITMKTTDCVFVLPCSQQKKTFFSSLLLRFRPRPVQTELPIALCLSFNFTLYFVYFVCVYHSVFISIHVCSCCCVQAESRRPKKLCFGLISSHPILSINKNETRRWLLLPSVDIVVSDTFVSSKLYNRRCHPSNQLADEMSMTSTYFQS